MYLWVQQTFPISDLTIQPTRSTNSSDSCHSATYAIPIPLGLKFQHEIFILSSSCSLEMLYHTNFALIFSYSFSYRHYLLLDFTSSWKNSPFSSFSSVFSSSAAERADWPHGQRLALRAEKAPVQVQRLIQTFWRISLDNLLTLQMVSSHPRHRGYLVSGLVSAFVTTRLDYCNSVLAGLPQFNSIQKIICIALHYE